MAYTYGSTNVVKHCYDIYITTSGGSASNKFNGTIADIATLDVTGDDFTAAWTKIGAIAENPTLKTAEGDTVALGDCTDKIISEIVEFSCEILEVTSANWTTIRAACHDVECDILFAEAIADADAIGATKVKLSAQLEITGNDQNKIVLTGKVENSDATNRIGFVILT